MSGFDERCRRCGAPLGNGSGRYLMVVTYIADAEFTVRGIEGNIGERISQVMDEIEKNTEEELLKQVYEKHVYLICRTCKETLSENPFPDSPSQPTDMTQ